MKIFNWSNTNSSLPTLAFLLTILPIPTALAVDGVQEINQACVATGCFPNDLAGFPITIKKGGAYILTSDIDVSNETDPENVTAIEVNIGNPNREGIDINLNGFSIIGPNYCLGTPVTSCTDAGAGIGIDSNDNSVTIRNGKIMGMGDDCIQVIAAAVVDNVQVSECAGDGISTSARARITNSIASRNGENGMLVGGYSFIVGNSVIGNLGWGLDGSGTVAYSQNVFGLNTGGNVNSSVQIGPNLCGTALCP